MQLAGPGVFGLPADVDGPRTVNQVIGRALSPFEGDVVVGNKVGAAHGPAGEWLIDNRPATVRAQVEESLTDLRTDHSPLTYLRLAGDAPGSTPDMLRRAQRITPIAAVQNRFDLVDRSGVEVLGAGALDGLPPAAVTLAWLLRRSPVIMPIPGTRSLDHLEDNLQATTIAHQLVDDEVQALTDLADEKAAKLDTMSEPMAATLARNRASTA